MLLAFRRSGGDAKLRSFRTGARLALAEERDVRPVARVDKGNA